MTRQSRVSLYLLLSLSCILFITTLIPNTITSAQDVSPTPSLTYTPQPTQPTATSTSTPLPDPTLNAVMSQRTKFSASNILNVGEFYRWSAYNEGVINLVFTPQGDLIATGVAGLQSSRFVVRWTIQDGSINPVGRAFQDVATGGISPTALQLSGNGLILSSASGGPGVSIWDAQTSQIIGYVSVASPASAIVSEDGLVLVGGSNGLASLWSINMPGDGSGSDYRESGMLPPNYEFHPSSAILLTAFRVDEEIVQVMNDQSTWFALTRTGALYLYRLSGSEILTEVRQFAPGGALKGNGIYMVLDRERQRVLYVNPLYGVLGYDYANQYPVTQLNAQKEIGCLALSPDSTLLIIGDASEEGLLHVYDAETYELITELDTGRALTSCIFNSEGTLLALGDTEGRIALWGVYDS